MIGMEFFLAAIVEKAPVLVIILYLIVSTSQPMVRMQMGMGSAYYLYPMRAEGGDINELSAGVR